MLLALRGAALAASSIHVLYWILKETAASVGSDSQSPKRFVEFKGGQHAEIDRSNSKCGRPLRVAGHGPWRRPRHLRHEFPGRRDRPSDRAGAAPPDR